MLEYFEKLQIACGVILFKGEPLIDRMTMRAPVGIEKNQLMHYRNLLLLEISSIKTTV